MTTITSFQETKTNGEHTITVNKSTKSPTSSMDQLNFGTWHAGHTCSGQLSGGQSTTGHLTCKLGHPGSGQSVSQANILQSHLVHLGSGVGHPGGGQQGCSQVSDQKLCQNSSKDSPKNNSSLIFTSLNSSKISSSKLNSPKIPRHPPPMPTAQLMMSMIKPNTNSNDSQLKLPIQKTNSNSSIIQANNNSSTNPLSRSTSAPITSSSGSSASGSGTQHLPSVKLYFIKSNNDDDDDQPEILNYENTEFNSKS